ncbi:MAG: hypothetical protein ABIJ05_05520 [Patescibacteria group bacterium]
MGKEQIESGVESMAAYLEEIRDPSKRQEFKDEYKRLIGQCTESAIFSTIPLYLLEQELQDKNAKETFPKVDIVVHNNTSKIIIRLVEEGFADCYLSNKRFLMPTISLSDKDDKPILFSWFLNDRFKYVGKKDGLPKLFRRDVEKIKSIKEKATLIPPEKIKDVFAKIDAKHKTSFFI